MKKLLNIGCGPIYLESSSLIECENSDFAETESSKSWKIDKRRDFTKPFEDVETDSVDYIVFWHCIEHLGLHEKDDVLKEFFRILKPTGELYIACPDLTKVARHIVNRDGPWADWFICAVNVYGPYNGFIGDYHKFGYDHAELGRVLTGLGYRDYQEVTPEHIAANIGVNNAQKLGFAEYNIQAVARK